MRLAELQVRAAGQGDLVLLRAFTCSGGDPWEEEVERQIRGPLPSRYLASPPRFDGRLLVGLDAAERLLVVGAHRIEPAFEQEVGYTEVIAVAREARGTLAELPAGEHVSLGQLMLLTIFRQMVKLGRHPRTFVRVDRRNTRSLALLDRVGLAEERPDPYDPMLVQRWGTLPT